MTHVSHREYTTMIALVTLMGKLGPLKGTRQFASPSLSGAGLMLMTTN
jgi:hypothetical protein